LRKRFVVELSLSGLVKVGRSTDYSNTLLLGVRRLVAALVQRWDQSGDKSPHSKEALDSERLFISPKWCNGHTQMRINRSDARKNADIFDSARSLLIAASTRR
jgi:hypothetical protein